MRALALAMTGLACLLGALTAHGGDETYRCVSGERIERGQSTWGHARGVSSGYRIEKGSSSVGWAIQRGSSKWAIETFGGSTLGWLSDDRIEHFNGSTWTQIETARRFAGCPDPVAAALWVLDQSGKL